MLAIPARSGLHQAQDRLKSKRSRRVVRFADEVSLSKSRRLKAAWEAKRKRASQEILSARCPQLAECFSGSPSFCRESRKSGGYPTDLPFGLHGTGRRAYCSDLKLRQGADMDEEQELAFELCASSAHDSPSSGRISGANLGWRPEHARGRSDFRVLPFRNRRAALGQGTGKKEGEHSRPVRAYGSQSIHRDYLRRE